MIDKELKVGDCIYLPYSSLDDMVADLRGNGVSGCGIPNYTQFANDTDMNNNIYFCVLEIAPWGTITLREINRSHGMIYLGNDFVKQNGKFVRHKELEVSEVRNSDNEVVAIRTIIPEDEVENQNKGIDDKMKAAKEAEANLKATEAKLIAKEAVKVQNIVSSDFADIAMRGLAMKQDDKVSHPSHYTWLKELCGIEVIDIARHLDFDKGNALKYLLRAGKKSEEGYSDKEKEIEDLKKAVFYIQDKIKMLEEENERD